MFRNVQTKKKLRHAKHDRGIAIKLKLNMRLAPTYTKHKTRRLGRNDKQVALIKELKVDSISSTFQAQACPHAFTFKVSLRSQRYERRYERRMHL